ncbi:MAG TPA: lysylphosphatidylglycerol synthase transmembrane domain-containing protein, partial [Vicinamibacteria bacterium]|nr:lysylphosphatidylglycerol synthase transmembrane domain-containing protein [Vicinamibacteria bacterium]
MTHRTWRLLAGLLLAAALLILFFRGLDLAAIGQALRSADRGLMAAVAGLTVVTYAARSFRWGFLLAPLGRVPFTHLYSATMIGFMTGLLVPRAGELVRPYLVARRHPIPISAGFASIILERLIDLVAALLLLFAYFYLLPRPEREIRGPLFDRLRAGGAITGFLALVVFVVLLLWDRYPGKVTALVERLVGWAPEKLARALS